MTPQENSRIERARMLIYMKRYTDAEVELKALLSQFPDNATGIALLGHCKSRRGYPYDGAILIRQAIGIRPDDDYLHYLLSLAYLEANNIDAAQRSITAALTSRPDDATYIAIQSNIYLTQARWNEALAAANRALASDPQHQLALTCRALALIRLERLTESEATIRSALRYYPLSEFYHQLLGQTRLDHGDVNASLDAFRESVRLDPTQDNSKLGLLTAMKARYWLYRIHLGFKKWRHSTDPQQRESSALLFTMITIAYIVISVVAWISPVFLTAFFVMSSLFALIGLIEPVANLVLNFNARWRHALDQGKRWIAWTTLIGLITAMIGAVFLLTEVANLGLPTIVFGLGLTILFGIFYNDIGDGQKKDDATLAVTVIILLGVASLAMPVIGFDTLFVTNFFVIGTFIGWWMLG